MDPSYSPNSYSQAPIMGSETGDVVVSDVNGGSKSKKPLIIAGAVVLVLAIVGAIVAVVMMKLPKKTAEEEYAAIEAVAREYSGNVKSINSFIKKGYKGRVSFSGFYDDCQQGIIKSYQDKITEFGSMVKNISFDSIDESYKDVVRRFAKEKAPAYIDAVSASLANLGELCTVLMEGGEDEISGFVQNNGLSESDKELLLAGTRAQKAKADYDSKCLGSNGLLECQELWTQYNMYDQLSSDKSAMKKFFQIKMDEERMTLIAEFNSSFNVMLNGLDGKIKLNDEVLETVIEGNENEE